MILIERVVAAALRRLAGDGWLAASCAWRRVGSPLLFSLGPALEAGEGRHGHGEHNSSIQLHRHRHGHEIDTLSSRYRREHRHLRSSCSHRRHDIRSDRGRSQGRERKGEHEPSCHHKYNPQTAPFALADLLIEESVLALHVLCVRHGLVYLFFLVDLFVLGDFLSPYSQAYSSKLQAQPGTTARGTWRYSRYARRRINSSFTHFAITPIILTTLSSQRVRFTTALLTLMHVLSRLINSRQAWRIELS